MNGQLGDELELTEDYLKPAKPEPPVIYRCPDCQMEMKAAEAAERIDEAIVKPLRELVTPGYRVEVSDGEEDRETRLIESEAT